MSTQKKEIETRERTFKLKLSDSDTEKLFFKSAKLGVTPEELIDSFIGDLVYGTHTNGSDERMFIEQWVERCWFCGNPPESFLTYLLNEFDEDVIKEIYDLSDDIASYQKELDQLCKTEPDNTSYIEYIRECIEECKEELKEYEEYYEEYKELNSKCGSFEDEIIHIVGWYEKMKKISSEE